MQNMQQFYEKYQIKSKNDEYKLISAIREYINTKEQFILITQCLDLKTIINEKIEESDSIDFERDIRIVQLLDDIKTLIQETIDELELNQHNQYVFLSNLSRNLNLSQQELEELIDYVLEFEFD